MLVILIASALIVVVAALGLAMCRLAALTDRNSALELAEWIATSLGERQLVLTDRAGEQSLFDPPSKAFRAAGR
jgi:Tfp pilus assembly protein PilX